MKIDAQDKENETALLAAISKGYIEIVKELLNHGADIDNGYCSDNQYTPLHWACKCGRENIVQLLLEKGARIEDGFQEGYSDNYYTEILSVMETKNAKIVRLLLDRGADVEVRFMAIILISQLLIITLYFWLLETVSRIQATIHLRITI